MIINANALSIPLADQSVHMIVTSPPYWGLRNYGVSGQLGLERTPEEYIANMVTVFRECWRVLRDDGTLWLNIGDSYAGSAQGWGHDKQYAGSKQRTNIGSLNYNPDYIYDRPPGYISSRQENGLKPKDLVGIPWRLAFALQADGWYLRSDIIWSKPNPMPESVTDRPTKSHEYLFLLAKQARYYYDQEAIKEESIDDESFSGRRQRNSGMMDDYDPKNYKFHGSISDGKLRSGQVYPSRNRRSVWTIPTAPYKGAHFATFPPVLVEPCIKAGTSERGCCPKCGKGWRRVIEKIALTNRHTKQNNMTGQDNMNGWEGVERRNDMNINTLGWQPSCTCDAGEHEYNEGLMCIKCQRAKWVIDADNLSCQLEPIPCLVFDPFVGSGTTVKVAYDLGRRGVGLDLSLDYLDDQARKRIHNGHIARLF